MKQVVSSLPRPWVSGRTSFYSAFTFNDSEYIGSGDPLVDANQGILAGTDVTGVPARLWVLSLVANNLLDEAHLSAITENAAWLGPPRTISMTATFSF